MEATNMESEINVEIYLKRHFKDYTEGDIMMITKMCKGDFSDRNIRRVVYNYKSRVAIIMGES